MTEKPSKSDQEDDWLQAIERSRNNELKKQTQQPRCNNNRNQKAQLRQLSKQITALVNNNQDSIGKGKLVAEPLSVKPIGILFCDCPSVRPRNQKHLLSTGDNLIGSHSLCRVRLDGGIEEYVANIKITMKTALRKDNMTRDGYHHRVQYAAQIESVIPKANQDLLIPFGHSSQSQPTKIIEEQELYLLNLANAKTKWKISLKFYDSVQDLRLLKGVMNWGQFRQEATQKSALEGIKQPNKDSWFQQSKGCLNQASNRVTVQKIKGDDDYHPIEATMVLEPYYGQQYDPCGIEPTLMMDPTMVLQSTIVMDQQNGYQCEYYALEPTLVIDDNHNSNINQLICTNYQPTDFPSHSKPKTDHSSFKDQYCIQSIFSSIGPSPSARPNNHEAERQAGNGNSSEGNKGGINTKTDQSQFNREVHSSTNIISIKPQQISTNTNPSQINPQLLVDNPQVNLFMDIFPLSQSMLLNRIRQQKCVTRTQESMSVSMPDTLVEEQQYLLSKPIENNKPTQSHLPANLGSIDDMPATIQGTINDTEVMEDMDATNVNSNHVKGAAQSNHATRACKTMEDNHSNSFSTTFMKELQESMSRSSEGFKRGDNHHANSKDEKEIQDFDDLFGGKKNQQPKKTIDIPRNQYSYTDKPINPVNIPFRKIIISSEDDNSEPLNNKTIQIGTLQKSIKLPAISNQQTVHSSPQTVQSGRNRPNRVNNNYLTNKANQSNESIGINTVSNSSVSSSNLTIVNPNSTNQNNNTVNTNSNSIFHMALNDMNNSSIGCSVTNIRVTMLHRLEIKRKGYKLVSSPNDPYQVLIVGHQTTNIDSNNILNDQESSAVQFSNTITPNSKLLQSLLRGHAIYPEIWLMPASQSNNFNHLLIGGYPWSLVMSVPTHKRSQVLSGYYFYLADRYAEYQQAIKLAGGQIIAIFTPKRTAKGQFTLDTVDGSSETSTKTVSILLDPNSQEQMAVWKSMRTQKSLNSQLDIKDTQQITKDQNPPQIMTRRRKNNQKSTPKPEEIGKGKAPSEQVVVVYRAYEIDGLIQSILVGDDSMSKYQI